MFARMLAASAAACALACAFSAQAQQLIAATAAMSDALLLSECRRVFDGKTFVGVIKNADFYRYRSGRRELVIKASVQDGPKLVSTQWLCPVVVRAETDDRYTDVREFLFDGSVANSVYNTAYGRHRRSLKPEDGCVRYTGTSKDNYGTVSSVGDSLLCPR